MRGVENRSPALKHDWPVGVEAPRLADGTVDVRALCRMWDDAVNEGLETEGKAET